MSNVTVNAFDYIELLLAAQTAGKLPAFVKFHLVVYSPSMHSPVELSPDGAGDVTLMQEVALAYHPKYSVLAGVTFDGKHLFVLDWRKVEPMLWGIPLSGFDAIQAIDQLLK